MHPVLDPFFQIERSKVPAVAICLMRGRRVASVSWQEKVLTGFLFQVWRVQSSLISAGSIRQARRTLEVSTRRGSPGVMAQQAR